MCRSVTAAILLLFITGQTFSQTVRPRVIRQLEAEIVIGLPEQPASSPIQRIAAQRAELIRSLEELEAAYIGSGMPDEAKLVHEQLYRLQHDALAQLPEIDRSKWPAQLRPSQLRGNVGEVHVVWVTGSLQGNVWGSAIYTDDSDVGTAAVHAGILEVGENQLIAFRLLPGRDSYTGSTAHGVMSSEYGNWHGSYQIIGPCILEPAFKSVPFESGKTVDVFVTGRTKGVLIGNGVYTIDSDLGVAAVHSGLLVDGEAGVIQVKMLPGQRHYHSATSHGIKSLECGFGDASIQLQPASEE